MFKTCETLLQLSLTILKEKIIFVKKTKQL